MDASSPAEQQWSEVLHVLQKVEWCNKEKNGEKKTYECHYGTGTFFPTLSSQHLSDHPHSHTATTARLSLFCRVLKPQELSSVPSATQSFSRGWSELAQMGRLFFLCNGKILAPFVLLCHYTLQSTVWNHSEILTSTQNIHYMLIPGTSK